MKVRPDTPLKRIGVLLIAAYIILTVIFAFSWNVSEAPFLYAKEDIIYDESDTKWYPLNTIQVPVSISCITKAAEGQPIESLSFEKKKEIALSCQAKGEAKRIWHSSLLDFLESEYFLKLCLLLILGITLLSELPTIILAWVKNAYAWVKTGHWERKPREEKIEGTRHFNLSPRLRKYIYGSIVITLWLTTEVLIRNSGIMLGAIPYTAIMMFWLWMFCRAIGRTFWGFRKIENDEEYLQKEKRALMQKYSITKNKDGNYEYNNRNYESYDEALNVARYSAE